MSQTHRITALFFLCIAVAACQPPYQPQPEPEKVGTNSTTILCKPTARSCNGAHVVQCLESGRDAIAVDDCSAIGTSGNPGVCDPACGAAGGACCRRQKPLLEWELTTPAPQAGAYYGEPIDGARGSAPARVYEMPPAYDCPGPTRPGDVNQYLTFRIEEHDASCPATGWRLAMQINRTKVSPGVCYNMPDEGAPSPIGIQFSDFSDPSLGCMFWTGKVQVLKDVPAWEVEVDVTCRTNNSIRLKGTVKGAQ